MPKLYRHKRPPLSPEEINRRYQITLSILVSMLRRQSTTPILTNLKSIQEISA